jgi:RND superfamily putative drug exporter
MGRWSASHWKTAVFGWLVFVVVVFAVGMKVGWIMLTPVDLKTGESATAQRILDGAHMPDGAREVVLVQNNRYRVDDPRFRAAIAATATAINSQPYTSDVRSPLDRGGQALVSRDRHSALVQFRLQGGMMEQTMRVEAPLAAVARTQAAHPGFRIEEFGDASFSKASTDSSGKDFQQAELLSVPVTVLILLLAFGAFVAAILPVLLALTAFVAAMGLMFVTSNVFHIDHSVFSVMLLIGLAVGVDYSLFYIRREREERAAGKSARAALEAAAATSGRSVLISGLTVIVAVAGLFLAGAAQFRGIAAGTMFAVAASVLGSLTVLPALLAKLGNRIESGRVPVLHRLALGSGESRFWNAILTPVLRRPAVAAAAATGLLVVLALPAARMHTILPSFDDYPRSMPILSTYRDIQRAFPGGPAPAQVTVRVDNAVSKQFADEVARFRTAALATGQLHEPITVQAMSDHVAVISVPLSGSGDDKVSFSALRTLRTQVIPSTLAGAAGIDAVAVGGDTASSADYSSTLGSHTPLVFAFVLGLAFLLMLVTFRSIVIALKAIVLNLLSVAAAYGVLVAVFQWGWGEQILGFHSNHGITVWIPLFLFVVLFGLSMDYHVFIISRIREAYERGLSTEEAVSHGIRTTAGVVTAAAMVMVVVFSIFGSLSQLSMKEIGTGLAVAVLLDATVVRAVLLPASMKLLGDWNWWLPKRLSWLPRVTHEGPTPEAPEAAYV